MDYFQVMFLVIAYILILLVVIMQYCVIKIIKNCLVMEKSPVVDENPDPRFDENGDFKDKRAAQEEEQGYVLADVMKSLQDLMSEE
jgi:hypothetical protein